MNRMYKLSIKAVKASMAGLMVLLTMLFSVSASAQQCNPAYTGDECEGSFLRFTANAPGANSYNWDFGGQGTSTQRDPTFTFTTAGTYDVKLETDGPAGKCEKTIQVVIKPSPKVNVKLLTAQQQCFAGNEFCWVDSSEAAPGSTILRRTIVIEDGGRYDKINPSKGDTICHKVIDPRGGDFDVTVELEDANGCVTQVTFPDAIKVWPRLGVEIISDAPVRCDSSLATITNMTYVNWLSNPGTYVGLKDLANFTFDFGDGDIIVGDSVTNTEYWTGDALDGIIKKWYRRNGTFDATLSVTSKFGCSESFTYKAAATTIKINPVILADKDSSCTSDPETCFRLKDGPIPGARFLWNFGDPPSGLLNFEDASWTPCHNYGGGPWMISLNIVVGPCDIMVFDTISKVGPSSTIEVPFVRVAESEKYQCTIRDSVRFVNNSTFYHDDPNILDEDSFDIDPVTGLRRYVFNYDLDTRQGDQTAIPNANPIRNKDHVWRLWTLGDNYAPQCTTDVRINKNVGLNCNYTHDTLPVHWYRPWDDIYKWENGGQFYKDPAVRVVFSKNSQECSEVFVYPDSVMVIPQEVIIFAPYDSAYTVYIPYTDENGVQQEDTLELDASTDYPETQDLKYYRLRILRPATVYNGPVIHTVIWDDQEFDIPANTTIEVKDLDNGFVTNVSGSKTNETIEVDHQFDVAEGDSIISKFKMIINPPDTTLAMESTYVIDTIINGVPSTVTKKGIFVDSAFHREQFFINRGQCNTVTLYHKDTVHPLKCESTNVISLALIPPSAKGLKWTSGIPCPAQPGRNQYFLEFDMGETKPGCTQQWFEVNYDSLTGPNNWVSYKSGGVLAAPAPGNPLPFILPYDIIGQWGTRFVKAYTAGEIGDDPEQRPNGSFTIGLVVGNGPPRVDAQGNAVAPECTDTAWYTDMFRYRYLNADFEVLIPNEAPYSICAGETAYFRILNPIQDSISALRWNWGYQDRLSGYYELFKYFETYTGPVKGRNDENASDWQAGNNWKYNFIERHSLDEVDGDILIDTIVTKVYRDWAVSVNTFRAGRELRERFEAANLDLNDIPSEDVILYMGVPSLGIGGCVDTTGISQLFDYGFESITENTVKHGNFVYQYTDANKSDSVIVEEIFHFRDSSLQGYDTLVAPYDLNTESGLVKKGETIPGVWKMEYKHKVLEPKACFPGQFDTLMVKSNGPMIPGLFLNNNDGCEKAAGTLLNVGYLNYIKLEEEAVCQNQIHYLYDSVRYWQYGDDQFPFDYPIDPRKWWENPDRFNSNLEIKTVNWDVDDPASPWDRSITFEHKYTEPGEYKIAFATRDSMGCTDTAFTTAMVTGVKANFEINTQLINCQSIVDFFDSSIVFDPCAARDTCPNGNYTPCDSILSEENFGYEWDFGDGSVTSFFKDPSHNYTSAGWYTVTLKIRSLLGCEDTISKQIYIAGPQPKFEFENTHPEWGQDSIIVCVGDPVTLVNLSQEPIYNPEWIVYWGDSSSNSSSNANDNFVHSYDQPGVYYLLMAMEDEIEGQPPKCTRVYPDTSTLDGKVPRKIKVIVRPVAESDLEIRDTIVCPDEIVTFKSNSDTIYKRFTWAFGDGDTATRALPEDSVFHSYSAPGTYNVVMVPDYDPIGWEPRCLDTAYGTVTVLDVIADFTVNDENKPEFCFDNTSTGATKYRWLVETETGDIVEFEDEDICYNWGEKKGEYEVCLIAENDRGCKDTTCQTINNDFVATIKPYNIFTPDAEDALNREFVVETEGVEEYEIKIFNRWGELVFESEDENNHWNGKVMNTGNDCPEGTYFYVINYKLKNRAENDGLEPISGQVTLIRE
jgi:gliding motility-associated-like protein